MEKTGVQKLAGILKMLVTFTIECNLLALFRQAGELKAENDLTI